MLRPQLTYVLIVSTGFIYCENKDLDSFALAYLFPVQYDDVFFSLNLVFLFLFYSKH